MWVQSKHIADKAKPSQQYRTLHFYVTRQRMGKPTKMEKEKTRFDWLLPRKTVESLELFDSLDF